MEMRNTCDSRNTPTTLTALLIWTYRDQRAHQMSHQPFALAEKKAPPRIASAPSMDGCRQLMLNHKLGHRIPATGHRQRLVLHPDADAVHQRLIDFTLHDPLGAELLFRHARQGLTPGYSDDIPIPHPVFKSVERGRERIVENVCRVGDGHIERKSIVDPKTGKMRLAWIEIGYPYCPLSYWPSIASVTESRREYRLWFNALTQLWPMIPPLRKWRIEAIGADPAPWGWRNDNCPEQDR